MDKNRARIDRSLLRKGYLLRKVRGKGYMILDDLAFLNGKEIILAGKNGSLSLEAADQFLMDINRGMRPVRNEEVDPEAGEGE